MLSWALWFHCDQLCVRSGLLPTAAALLSNLWLLRAWHPPTNQRRHKGSPEVRIDLVSAVKDEPFVLATQTLDHLVTIVHRQHGTGACICLRVQWLQRSCHQVLSTPIEIVTSQAN